MPGSGSAASWAYVAPPSGPSPALLQELYAHNAQQQQRKLVEQQRELQRQSAAAKHVGDAFKDDNYATGTAADPIINKMTADARTKFSDLIHKNPNMDEGELENQMQAEMGKISQFSAKVKAGTKSIAETANGYASQHPGIDASNLRYGATNRFLFDTDPATGKQTLKDPNNIDLTKNYMDDELLEHPDKYVQGDTPLSKTIEMFKPKEDGNSVTTEHAGQTTENKYTAKLFPWQSIVKDKKGIATGVQTNSIPATLSNGKPLIDPDTREPMKIVDDQTLASVMTKGVAAQIKRDTDAYIKSKGYNPADFTPGSEAYNLLGKHILYNKLHDLTPSEFKPETKKTNASFVDKMQAGILNLQGKELSKKDAAEKDKLLNGNFGKLRQAVNLTPEAVQASLPYTDPASGKKYLDVTSFVGGFGTDADVKGTEYKPGFNQVQHLLIDPDNPGKLYTVEGAEGHVQEYNEKGIDAIMLRHGSANGHDKVSDVKKIIDGIPIKPDIRAARQARAALELQRRQQEANATQAITQPLGQ